MLTPAAHNKIKSSLIIIKFSLLLSLSKIVIYHILLRITVLHTTSDVDQEMRHTHLEREKPDRWSIKKDGALLPL
jgi:hypothetical protein